MRTTSAVLLIIFVLSPTFSQTLSDTLGLWHLDELTGTTLLDSSPLHNNAYASGTSSVSGAIANARYFNGYSSYATIPSHTSYNFHSEQSFTVSVWVKTNQPEGIIVRRGLDPLPGFQISIHYGKAIGRIGNTKGNTWNDTLLTLTSTQLINDNVWHEIRMVRDRSVSKLFLYVDGISATSPAVDNFLVPLTNTRPLTFGASLILPDYFTGPIDEVGIFNGALHPTVITSDTVALWHYDETSGNTVFDSSPYRNNGTATGTSIVAGRIGNARYFNGTSDYVWVSSRPIFNMNNEQSFTIDLWFKTSGSPDGWLIRRGLAPTPGFSLGISSGRLIGEVGNREDGTPPDTLLMLFSDRTYVDGEWHHATFVRDRSVRKLYLYVDGQLAANPMNDNFPLALTNDRPLIMGRWETRPEYFRGYLDEVAIFRGARHPVNIGAPSISLNPPRFEFGNVIVGGNAARTLTVSNAGLFDTLRVTGIESSSNLFALSTTPFTLAPGASRNIQVTYSPTVARVDTGAISIVSNDPSRPIVRVPLSGQGFTVGVAPFITSIRDIPDDQGKQVRVIWYKSIHDANGDSLRITEYSVWRRVAMNNALWDFVASVPAVRFDQYSFVAPTLYDSTQANGIRWSVFKVSAHTVNGTNVYFSAIDSGYSIDNLPPSAPTSLIANIVGGRINLAWERPTDPDIQFFAVYRSTSPNVLPTSENQIGSAVTTNFIDQTALSNTAYYYCIAAFDTAGNRSGTSNQAQIILTGINSNTLPTAYQLYQNYPNPFNPTSNIRYDVPQTSHVTITLYDMLGRIVATLVDEEKTAGTFQTSVNANGLSSGVYLYRMQAGMFVEIRKMILMK